jgi:hypothetical protein
LQSSSFSLSNLSVHRERNNHRHDVIAGAAIASMEKKNSAWANQFALETAMTLSPRRASA